MKTLTTPAAQDHPRPMTGDADRSGGSPAGWFLLGAAAIVAACGFFLATSKLIGWLMPPPAAASHAASVSGI